MVSYKAVLQHKIFTEALLFLDNKVAGRAMLPIHGATGDVEAGYLERTYDKSWNKMFCCFFGSTLVYNISPALVTHVNLFATSNEGAYL